VTSAGPPGRLLPTLSVSHLVQIRLVRVFNVHTTNSTAAAGRTAASSIESMRPVCSRHSRGLAHTDSTNQGFFIKLDICPCVVQESRITRMLRRDNDSYLDWRGAKTISIGKQYK
jgi:hypothetical protein